VETHNHPSAIEPYAGANTGPRRRDPRHPRRGQGREADRLARCLLFRPARHEQDHIKADDVIHPLGVMRGVVRGVRDYGNRMGIPTSSGAIQFDDTYIYNPLVFCGTAGSSRSRTSPRK
jgi:phosphoribosylformylglycinamidine (FGAM) synthase-like enzyme